MAVHSRRRKRAKETEEHATPLLQARKGKLSRNDIFAMLLPAFATAVENASPQEVAKVLGTLIAFLASYQSIPTEEVLEPVFELMSVVSKEFRSVDRKERLAALLTTFGVVHGERLAAILETSKE